MTNSRAEYIENCRKMKVLNRQKWNDVIDRANNAYSLDTEKALRKEANGWLKWVNYWQDLECEALAEDRNKGA